MKAARSACKTAADLPVDTLATCYLGRVFGLKDVIPELHRMQLYLSLISQCPAVDELPFRDEERIREAAVNLAQWFTRATQVQDTNRDAQREHDQLRREFDSRVNSIQTEALPSFAVAGALDLVAARQSQLQQFQEDLNKAKEQVTSMVAGIALELTKAQQSAAEADTARARAAEAATNTAISAQQKLFKEESDRHRKTGYGWIVAGVLLAIAGGGFAWQVYVDAKDSVAFSIFVAGGGPSPSPPASLTVQLITAKVAIMALMVSLVFWTGRMYRASVHNEIINRHRANALGTFATFVDGASPEIKSAVLLQTTSCIFSPQHTGLITSEADPHPMTYVAEVARAVGSSATTASSSARVST